MVLQLGVLTKEEYNQCLFTAESILGETGPVSANLVIDYEGTTLQNLADPTGATDGILYPNYSVDETNQKIVFSGGYGRTGNINQTFGSFEIFCKIPSTFAQRIYPQWYNCSCIMGCELDRQQQDFGLIIDRYGYFAIGYSFSNITSSPILAKDDSLHHLVLIHNNTSFRLYIDTVLRASVQYSTSGIIPSNYGIFWNNNGSVTHVDGEFYQFRYYTSSLTESEILQNYNYCLSKVTNSEEGDSENG